MNRLAELRQEISSRPGAQERIRRDVARMQAVVDLEKLRAAQQLTQTELASRMGVSQKRVSNIERSEDIQLTTLRRYVESLGGKLEVTVLIDGDRLPLTLSA